MRIAIFGGTFNPPHLGHENCIKSVQSALELDKLIVMPDKLPPHKQAENLATESDRLNMCRLAFESESCECSDWELKGEGRSYTVITLRHFREIYPSDKLYFIMGSDMLLSFDKWYCYEEILRLSALVCVSRSDEDTERIKPCAERLKSIGGDIEIAHTEPLDISSTQIRTLVAQRKFTKLSCYLNENVVKYIVENKLYL